MPTVSSVVKRKSHLIITYSDGVVVQRSIVEDDIVTSLTPEGYEKVGIIYVDATAGTLIVNYNGQSIELGAAATVASDDISFTLDEYTSPQTLTADNYLVLVNALSGDITITLPAATSHANRIYTIKKIDSSGNPVTIDANGTEEIDGEQSVTLNLQFAYITIVCDGDEWFITGGGNVKIEDILSESKEIQKSIEVLLKQNKKLLKAILSVEAYGKNLSNNEEDYR